MGMFLGAAAATVAVSMLPYLMSFKNRNKFRHTE
jgi:hypothetical protein